MIGLICAETAELNEISKLMQLKTKKITNHINKIYGKISNQKIVAVKCGVGKVSAAMCCEEMIITDNPDIIINLGVCGAIKNGIHIGDLILADTVIQYDFDVSAFNHRKKGEISDLGIVNIPCSKKIVQKFLECNKKHPVANLHIGCILTADKFVNSNQTSHNLYNDFKGIACEMEAGSIGQVCAMNNIEFAVLKAVSDNANDNAPIDFSKFITQSSKQFAALLKSFIESIQD